MKKIFSLALIVLGFMANAQAIPTSIHGFKVEDIAGNTFDFAQLKGKKVMIVNTASECGYTPQYKDLQELYTQYKSKNFIIIGFPCNDFFSQEPGSNSEIATFCKKNFGVTFPMMDKITVKGKKKHPVYQYLTQKKYNGLQDSSVKWNFQKYLINEKGMLEKVVPTGVSPTDPSIIAWITK
ncbi:MAG: Glutathione peroxidase BsaA [Bacteroidota bacterium]|jgi:glutathione peroxidase